MCSFDENSLQGNCRLKHYITDDPVQSGYLKDLAAACIIYKAKRNLWQTTTKHVDIITLLGTVSTGLLAICTGVWRLAIAALLAIARAWLTVTLCLLLAIALLTCKTWVHGSLPVANSPCASYDTEGNSNLNHAQSNHLLFHIDGQSRTSVVISCN